MDAPARLTTDRLLLRPWSHDDAPRLLDMLSRREVMKWLGDGEPRLMESLAEAHERVDRYAERSAVPPLGFWAVEVVETRTVVGTVLLSVLPNAEAGEVEIGWHLHPDAWGRGYATEAARELLGHAFASGLPEVLAVTHLGNERSQNVCRKLGMRDEGVVHRWYDEPSQLFRITTEEWHGSSG